MSSELLATYSGLGVRDGEEYYKGEECLACVKDLIRSLRDDDSSCEIRRQLGKACILQRDLLPILVTSASDTVLRNDVIRLLVNLTQPAYLCFGSEYPKKKDIETMKCFMEVNHYLRQYKEAFTTENVMHVLGSVLAELCQKEWEDRDDDDIIVIERILLLLRNVLHITPDAQEEKRTEDDVSIHDQVIWNLHVNGMDELLLFLGSNPDESQWCMHVVEIVFLMMREQSASALARTGKGRSAEEKKRDEDVVEEVLAREQARKLKARQIRGARHSRFGGTFVVTNQKSIAGTERVYHRSLAGLSDYSYDVEKRRRRTPKPRRATADVLGDRMSTYSIRIILKNMCVQFLECCFNPLMRVVRENIMHNRAMDNDESYYLWALRFFLEFSRTHDFRVDIVGEALQLPTLHYIIRLMANYYDSMVMEKKRVQDARQWGQRLHYALQAYKELLLYINEMITSKDENLRENAKVMQNNIFYHPEYRDIFVTLFRNFREVFQTKSYLRDLVETTHVYVRMMERFGHDNRHMVVQGRRKKSSKKSKRSKRGPKHPGGVLTEHQLIDLWEKMDARVEELLEGRERLPDTAVPFDATSEIPIEEQKIVAMGRIRLHLIEACHAEAVSLMRAAREVWPDDAFGHSEMSVGEELDTIKAILFNPAAALPAARLLEDADDDEDGEGEEEEGGGGEVVTYETEFDLNKYIQRFSNNKIVRAYSMVLADYRTNPDTINHAVVKMLHRISVDLKMAPLLYQLSVFRTMQAILHEPATGRYKELQKFGRYIVSGFFHMAGKNPLLFAELLFWKTSRDCYELTEGYGTLEREKELRQLSSMWTREQEEELAELYERFKEEEDIVACIEAALPKDIPRSRRQIAAQLVKQGLVGSTKEVYKHKKKGVWSEEELCQLREVFNPGEDHKTAVQGVAEYFPGRGLRDITQQLRSLGLLPKRNKRRRTSSNDVNSGSEEEGTNEVAPPPKRGKKKAGVDGGNRGERRRGRKEGVTGLVSHLHDNGYSHQLAWLEAYLNDEARDRRLDDEWEEMCIVPVSETVSKALELDRFQKLLSSLGLQPPTQQEIYWRIPPTMTPAQLNSAADSLKVPVQGAENEGGSGEEEEEEENEREEEDEREEKKEKEEEEKSLVEADDSDDQFNLSDEGEMSVSDALAALRNKRKKLSGCSDELERKGSPTWAGGPKVPKKPRLATHSSFLESGSEDDEHTHQNTVAKRQEDVGSDRSATVDTVLSLSTLGRKRVRHVMDSDSDDEQDDDDDGDNDPGRVEGNTENLSSPDEANHLLNPNPLESLPTSSQMANTVDDEVDSAADCDLEKEQHHGNEGSMSKLALSETQSEQTVDPSQLQRKTLNQKEQSPESHPGGVVSMETSVPQPQTYTDNVESSGDIELDERDESNRFEDDGCGHRSKRRRVLLDLESSDEEP